MTAAPPPPPPPSPDQGPPPGASGPPSAGPGPQPGPSGGAGGFDGRQLKDQGTGFFKALFDLKFENFVALKFSAVVYVLYIAYFGLIWLGFVVLGIIIVSQGAGAAGVLFLLAAIFLGWIPALLCVLLVRVVIEFLVAGIRTAINTGKLVERS